jgi:CRP/FNR family transcriptional regulator, cyclic AMP receptor protein
MQVQRWRQPDPPRPSIGQEIAGTWDGGAGVTLRERTPLDAIVCQIVSAMPSRTNAIICHVLREDPDLAEGLSPDRRERAVQECIAPMARVRRGRWSGEASDIRKDGIGLLVLEGLLVRRVGVDGRFGAELLGEGDLLRPWQGEDALPTLPRTTGWRVLEPTRMAVLDSQLAYRMARYPELTGRVVARALERSRNLAVNMAIVHHPRVDIRLHMLLWHLADRWGHVRTNGVILPLRLTHTVLADLVAARRPTVSTTLAELARRGLVEQVDDGWLLLGGPPGELLELRNLSITEANRPTR